MMQASHSLLATALPISASVSSNQGCLSLDPRRPGPDCQLRPGDPIGSTASRGMGPNFPSPLLVTSSQAYSACLSASASCAAAARHVTTCALSGSSFLLSEPLQTLWFGTPIAHQKPAMMKSSSSSVFVPPTTSMFSFFYAKPASPHGTSSKIGATTCTDAAVLTASDVATEGTGEEEGVFPADQPVRGQEKRAVRSHSASAPSSPTKRSYVRSHMMSLHGLWQSFRVQIGGIPRSQSLPEMHKGSMEEENGGEEGEFGDTARGLTRRGDSIENLAAAAAAAGGSALGPIISQASKPDVATAWARGALLDWEMEKRQREKEEQVKEEEREREDEERELRWERLRSERQAEGQVAGHLEAMNEATVASAAKLAEGIVDAVSSKEHLALKTEKGETVKFQTSVENGGSPRSKRSSSFSETIAPNSCGEGCGACQVAAATKPTAGEPALGSTPASVQRFLSPASQSELRQVSLLSLLSDMAYNIRRINPSDLFRKHRLLFVTSSLEVGPPALPKASNTSPPKQAEKDPMAGPSSATGESADAETDAFELALDVSTCDSVSCVVESLHLSQEAEKEVEEVLRIRKEKELFEPSPVPPPVQQQEPEKRSFFGRQKSEGSGAKGAAGNQSASAAPVAPAAPVCPCEWFICDEPATNTRHVVIQGSNSLASWQANLSFAPVMFEDPALGVRVHGGIYEAAKALYATLVPLILSFVNANGGPTKAKISFTGHSLGGSLAILLSLLLIMRGEVPLDVFGSPVYAFGAPSIMCGGERLLEKLGLPQEHLRQVMMHRDLVPRAFACDYPAHVAEVLRKMSSAFRQHPCLQHQRLLYSPLGSMLVLQPSIEQSPHHPLLPHGSGLFHVRHPEQNNATLPHARARCEAEVRTVQRAILNNPHPLEILADRASYGSEGAISRDHDPANYFKGLRGVLRQEVRKTRKVRKAQKRQMWWPVLNTEPAGMSAAQEGTPVPILVEQASLAASPRLRATDVVNRPPNKMSLLGLGTSQNVLRLAAGIAKPWTTAVSTPGETSMRRRSLIASQHVHLGLLALLSAPLVIDLPFTFGV